MKMSNFDDKIFGPILNLINNSRRCRRPSMQGQQCNFSDISSNVRPNHRSKLFQINYCSVYFKIAVLESGFSTDGQNVRTRVRVNGINHRRVNILLLLRLPTPRPPPPTLISYGIFWWRWLCAGREHGE